MVALRLRILRIGGVAFGLPGFGIVFEEVAPLTTEGPIAISS
jgi:hypothetical protein